VSHILAVSHLACLGFKQVHRNNKPIPLFLITFDTLLFFAFDDGHQQISGKRHNWTGLSLIESKMGRK
jgi:hypothetical protein